MLRSPMGPQMGGWQSILGRAVRERRQELELTLDEASRAIGISRSHLNLIELGKATGVSGEAVERIDAGLGSQGALVALLLPKDAADVTRSEEMRRAEFNKAVVALAASLFFDPERLTKSQKVDAALLRDHESLTRDFVRRQHHARPQTILGPTRAHLNQLLSLESTSLSPSMRQQLDRIIGETAALAGWVAFRSNGDLVTAHAQLALGRQHAREAGDDILLAQLLAATSSLHSSLDLPRGGEDQRSPLAVSLLQAAQRKAGTGPRPVHGWIAVRLAMEQALHGETRRPVRHLGREPLPGMGWQDTPDSARPGRNRVARTGARHDPRTAPSPGAARGPRYGPDERGRRRPRHHALGRGYAARHRARHRSVRTLAAPGGARPTLAGPAARL
jgi:transcriptional regulator with XRE-family HTH domain